MIDMFNFLGEREKEGERVKFNLGLKFQNSPIPERERESSVGLESSFGNDQSH